MKLIIWLYCVTAIHTTNCIIDLKLIFVSTTQPLFQLHPEKSMDGIDIYWGLFLLYSKAHKRLMN